MKQEKYTGIFQSQDGHTYELIVTCNGYLQAFFLLTADAIRSGKHYQLHSIINEKGNSVFVDNIFLVNTILKESDARI